MEPIFILVRPQLGENIGSSARAMLNFGLNNLRLVEPRDGWPNPRAKALASGAGSVLDNTIIYILLCIMGGSLISNSSGIKFIRIYILVKTAAAEIIRLVRPNNIFNNTIFYSEKKIDNQTINLSFLIFISFFISIFILYSILVLDNISFESSFKLSILTLTNTTNSTLYGITDIRFADLFYSTKLFLILFMIIGKIELISILILLKKLLFKE